jgi:magnesium chelatase accessory protein
LSSAAFVARDADWPNRDASRFVAAGDVRWHVQVMGRGPSMLLLHGTGAATHSWRDLAPRLAARYTVIAPDLPGHGLSGGQPLQAYSLEGMAAATAGLLDVLGAKPEVVIGHSAGAAILARLCLDGRLAPRAMVSLCGALLPLGGLFNPVFSRLVRGVVCSPQAARFFAARAADPAVFERLMGGTGSVLDAEGARWYRDLAMRPGHVAAALAMMAHWDVRGLARDLPRLRTRLLLVAARGDRMIPVSHAESIRALVPHARLAVLDGAGHLAHEEQPARVAALVEDFLLRDP